MQPLDPDSSTDANPMRRYDRQAVKQPAAGDTLEAVIVGAGIAGLCMAMRLRRAGIDDFVILDAADGLGGTWRDNTYPGLACDVPAMLYSISFEPKRDWSRKYPPQAEILEYLQRCAERYDLLRRTRFATHVDSARFDSAAGGWHIYTSNDERWHARFLIAATGQLNRPYTPSFAGQDRFRGRQFHSARWEHDFDPTDKRIAVIGNAASAIQFVPQIAPQARQLYVLQRSANWMVARRDRAYTRVERALLQRVPGAARLLRGWLWLRHELRWPVFARGGGALHRLFQAVVRRGMHRRIPDERLRETLTPRYPLGCKRILLSDDYYPALTRDNVTLVTEAVERLTDDALVTADGVTRTVDAVIYATGFRTTEFVTPMKVYGRDGRELSNDAWQEGAEAYLGMTVPRFPNFFMLYGPNTNLGHNSIIFMIEQQVGYVLQCIQGVRDRQMGSLELRPWIMQRWRRECACALQRTVWATHCDSWYKTASGRIVNNWPYSTLTYWWRTRRPNFGDYELHPPSAQQPAQHSRQRARA